MRLSSFKGIAMAYTKEAILKIENDYAEIHSRYHKLMFKLTELNSHIRDDEAREYLMQGVGRRLKTLARCVKNIFEIFPADRSDLLTKDELTDLAINLHAFFINVSGILDNLAWVFVYENDLVGKPKEGKLGRRDVGLFNNNTLKHLGDSLKEYLESDRMQTWYANYSKNYRDALAHRIPLYVPPSELNKEDSERYSQIEEQLHDYSSPEAISKHQQLREEQQKLERPCFFFAQSLREDAKAILFHPQIIADFKTIEEITIIFCNDFFGKESI